MVRVSNTGSARGLPSLRDSFMHQFALIFTAVFLALGLSWLYVSNSPLTYTATSVILLSPSPGNPLVPETASGSAVQMTVALETEAQLIRTRAVADVVGEIVDREIPESGERLAVSVPSNTQMLEISFTSNSPEAAQEGSQAFAEGYLSFREERARTLQESQIEQMSAQVEDVDANLRRATSEATGEDVSTYASQEAQLLADRLAKLNDSLSDTRALNTHPGTVITAAELPERSNQIPAWMIVTAGGVFGLVAGFGLAVLREWRRDLVRESDEVDLLGLPIFASIGLENDEVLSPDSDPMFHESYRQLRTAVIANSPRPHILAVTEVVTEPVAGDSGRSANVAVNLAIVLAEARFSVLLISTASQRSDIEALLEVDPAEGLAEAARGDARPDHLLIETRGISFLTSGLDANGSPDLTSTRAFREMVDELYPQFDYIVLATSPAGSADGDAALLSSHSALVVLAPGAITRSLLGATLDRLGRLGISVDGAVMVSHTSQRGRDSKHVHGALKHERARDHAGA